MFSKLPPCFYCTLLMPGCLADSLRRLQQTSLEEKSVQALYINLVKPTLAVFYVLLWLRSIACKWFLNIWSSKWFSWSLTLGKTEENVPPTRENEEQQENPAFRMWCQIKIDAQQLCIYRSGVYIRSINTLIYSLVKSSSLFANIGWPLPSFSLNFL